MRWTLLLLGAALARNSAKENKEKRKKSRLLRKRVKKFERITAKKRGNHTRINFCGSVVFLAYLVFQGYY